MRKIKYVYNPYKKKYSYKRYALDVVINIITFGLF